MTDIARSVSAAKSTCPGRIQKGRLNIAPRQHRLFGEDRYPAASLQLMTVQKRIPVIHPPGAPNLSSPVEHRLRQRVFPASTCAINPIVSFFILYSPSVFAVHPARADPFCFDGLHHRRITLIPTVFSSLHRIWLPHSSNHVSAGPCPSILTQNRKRFNIIVPFGLSRPSDLC